MITRRAVLAGLVGLVGTMPILVGCAGQAQAGQHPTAKSEDLLPYTGLAKGASATFPSFVSAEVKDGYQFAIERPDVLKVLPCYCGCGLTSGHKNNLDCFILGQDRAGGIQFDDHASFCQTCLDIARDAKRLVAEGKSLPEIRAYVDQANGQKGPATDTPKPTARAAGTVPVG